MNSNVTTSYVRRRLSLSPGVYVALLLSVLAILVVNDFAVRRVEHGITRILTEHLPTTAYATQRSLTLECFLQNGRVLSNPNQGNGGSLPDMLVTIHCLTEEYPATSGEPIPAPKSSFDPDNSATSPKSSPDQRTASMN